MHARAVLAGLVVMSCTNHPASQAPSEPRAPAPGELPREDPDWLGPIAAKRIVYSIPGMEQLTAKADVIYKRAGNEVLTLDVWSPKVAGPRPAIVFVHGGPIPGNPPQLRHPGRRRPVTRDHRRGAAVRRRAPHDAVSA